MQATVNAAVVATVSALSAPVMATATAQALTPASTATPTQLRYAVSSGLMSVPAGVDLFAMSEAIGALAAIDYRSLDRLRATGRVFDVVDGDEGVPVQVDLSSARLRMTTGNAAGKTLYLPAGWVRRLP